MGGLRNIPNAGGVKEYYVHVPDPEVKAQLESLEVEHECALVNLKAAGAEVKEAKAQLLERNAKFIEAQTRMSDELHAANEKNIELIAKNVDLVRESSTLRRELNIERDHNAKAIQPLSNEFQIHEVEKVVTRVETRLVYRMPPKIAAAIGVGATVFGALLGHFFL